MPRTIVTFRSSRFNTSETKENYINPENFGDDTATWLAEQLERSGSTIEKGEEFPGQEDFGWYFNFDEGDDKYCLVIGSRADDNDQLEWLVWIEKNCGFIGSLLGGRKRNISGEVAEKIHKVLSESNDINDIKWHDPKDFDAGKEDSASDRP